MHRESWEMGDANHAQAVPEAAPVIAKAHHGSVSKEQRLTVERELKSGELRCVVATASLELGIDMGSIDLVLQVAPPPSVASGVQRVGRADHRVGGRPRGVIYPVQRTQLIDAAVVAEGMRLGAIERTVLVPNALDVLAQQTVAAASVEDLETDAWYRTVRRAAPYRDLPRSSYDSVLELLIGGYSTADLADLAPRLIWDRQAGTLVARPGAQRLAVTASGTIPDRGTFPVLLPEGADDGGRRRVGELDEEMVNETSVGDVITLGTTSWRVREITGDRVVVDPAPGRSSRLPFWRGDGPGRPAATGAARGAFLREAAAGLDDAAAWLAAGAPAAAPAPGAVPAPGEVLVPAPGEVFVPTPERAPEVRPALLDRLAAAGLDARARANLVDLLREQKAATGVVPSDTTLVLERNEDVSGSLRLILHSPFGRRVHEPWAMAIRERVRTTMGFEPQLVVADDGIVLQVPVPVGPPPGPELVAFDAAELTSLVRSRIDETALFSSRFRECAARALLMPRPHPGRRVPLWLQRLKSGQLLQAARQFHDFPILIEAARECLQDVYDLDALASLMGRIAAGTVRVVDVTTRTPSPLAAPLLFGYTAALLYQEDLPHAERRAHLLSLDPDAVAALLGDDVAAELLDEDTVKEVEADLQRLAPLRRARADVEGVADLLRELGPLTVAELTARCRGGRDDEAAVRAALGELEQSRRALQVPVGTRRCWSRLEDAPVLRAALGAAVPDWVEEQARGRPRASHRSPLGELVLRYARTHARVTGRDVAEAFGLGEAVAEDALAHLADGGELVRLGGGDAEARWMVPEVLRRVRSRSLARAREAVEPVSPYALQRLVLSRAGLAEPRAGTDALAEAIAVLEGVWLPAAQWEEQVLPARVADYRPTMLDDLIASGDIVWQSRTGAVTAGDPGEPEGGAPLTVPGPVPAPGPDTTRLVPEEIAFFPSDSPLAPVVGESLEAEALSVDRTWRLTLSGSATARSFEPVRRALAPRPAAAPRRRVRSRRGRGRYAGLLGTSAPADPLSWSTRTVPVTPDNTGRAAVPGATGRGPVGSAAGGPAGSPGVSAAGGPATAAIVAGAVWHRLHAPQVGDAEAALASVESLIDRYGIITPDLALAAGTPGGFGHLLPLLRRMEDTGALMRGRFVEGFGPAQLAERETVDALRALDADGGAGRGADPRDGAGPEADGRGGPGCRGYVVVDLKDPACLVGRGVPWPEPALPPGLQARQAPPTPTRRRGTSVVLLDGRPVLYAAETMRALVSYTAEPAELEAALRALVGAQRRAMTRQAAGAVRRRLVESLNGIPAVDRAVSALLAGAGLARDPRGMRLTVDPSWRDTMGG